MPLDREPTPRQSFTPQAKGVLEKFVGNDEYFIRTLGYTASDRALFRLYMDDMIVLTKLGHDAEIMRSMLESFMEMLAEMRDGSNGASTHWLLKNDASFLQIAKDYYSLTPSRAAKAHIVSEWEPFLGGNIAVGNNSAESVLADQTAEYRAPLLAAMTTEISGDSSRGEIVFSGRSVSDRIRGKAPIIAPLTEKLGTIKGSCGNPIGLTMTLNHTVRLFRHPTTYEMFLCITGAFGEGMIVEFSSQGEARKVYKSDDFSYPILQEHQHDQRGNTNVFSGQGNVHVAGGFRMGDTHTGGGSGGGQRGTRTSQFDFSQAGGASGGPFKKNVVSDGSTIRAGGMSRIGDSGPEDIYNIERLTGIYQAWGPDVAVKTVVATAQAFFGEGSSVSQDTDFGDNCIVIDLVRSGGKGIRSYVLYRGSFGNVSAIQKKYTKNGVQPLILGKMGG